jgi:Polyketide cyclase / dehydrase and lipid transport
MRIVKLFLIGVIVLFLVSTCLSLLFPSHMRVSRGVNVAVSRAKVYAVVTDLATWDRWNSFIKGTPLTGKSVSTPSAGKGAVLRSDQLVITEGEPEPGNVPFDWNQMRGRRFQGGFNLLQFRPDSLTVQYWFDFRFRWYPWEKLGIFVYDRQWGPVLQESLDTLKLYLENSP